MPKDLRFAWRLFRAAPAASLSVSGVLGLAMATTAVVFILVDALLLHPLPVPNQDQILHLGGLHDLPSGGDAVAWWGQARPLESLARYRSGEVSVEAEGQTLAAQVTVVSSEFFQVFQTRPSAGRTFGKADLTSGLDRVAILSERFRRVCFPDRPAPLGAESRLHGVRHVVVGIVADGFDFPATTQVWIPRARAAPADELLLASDDSVRNRRLEGWVGRLRAGASIGQARLDLTILNRRLQERRGARSAIGILNIVPLRQILAGELRPALRALLVGALLVLLVAAANCGTFLVSRAAARRSELAVRRALGATPRRLGRQTMTEAVAFSLLGGVFAAALAIALLIGVERWFSVYLDHRPPDPKVVTTAVLACVLLAVLVGIVAGMLSMWESWSAAPFEGLRDHGVGLGSHGRSRIRRTLVVVQIAGALVLTNSALLALQTFRNLGRLDLGFQPRAALAAQILFRQKNVGRERFLAAQQSLIDALAGVPQVTAVGAVNWLPLSSRGMIFVRRGAVYDGGTMSEVSGDYFQAMGIAVLSGRTFLRGERDAIVIGSRMARRFWPEGNPVGDSLAIEGEPRPRRVVGIVSDTQNPALTGSMPEFQMYAQYADPFLGQLGTFSMAVVARCRGDCRAITGLVAERLRGAVVGADVRGPVTFDDLVSRTLYPARARALLSGVYAAVVFGVALVGVYTLVSYLSLLRRRELSVRMALGASPKQIVRLVAGEGLVLAALGVLLGGLASWLGATLLRSLLFGVEQLSLGTIAATGATLLLGAVLASLIPALQASRRHPSEVLRDS